MQCDTVPLEILLESFKRLDCKERVRARGVCKEWLKIIDDNRSLWRSLDCSVDMNDEAEPKALILFDEKSQSTLEDVSIHMTKVEDVSIHMTKVKSDSIEGQKRKLDRLFNTLRRSSDTLKSVILKAENSSPVKDRASEVLLKYPNLDTFMFFNPRYFHSHVVILQEKACNKNSTVERSKLQVFWTSSPSSSSLNCPRLLENLTSLAVRWDLPASDWRQILQASARSLKHLQISMKRTEVDVPIISTLEFPNLKVLEMQCEDRFPEWMIFPSTTILILQNGNVKENLPPVYELWVSGLLEGLNLGKCCPSLSELRIKSNLTVERHREIVLVLLHERRNQVAIGLEVGGVRMVPLKRIVLPFKNCKGGFLDEVRELVEEVVDLDEVPNKIRVYI